MEIKIITNIHDIEKLEKISDILADENNCNLPFQRIRLPIIWWKHFNSINSADFGSLRGRNYLGRKSWLLDIYFIVIEDQSKIVGISPLFKNRVLYRGKDEYLDLITFCPDTVIFYFQDFIILKERRKEIIEKMFEGITKLINKEKALLMLSSIQENSINISLIRNELKKKKDNGCFTAEAVNCRKGGIYPWNINELLLQLKKLNSLKCLDNEVKCEILELIESINKNSSLLIGLAATRKKLENKLLAILKYIEKNDECLSIKEKLEEILKSCPIKYPYLNLQDDINDFNCSLSKSKRYYYKRYMKKYYDAGGQFENIDPKKITENDLETFYNLHQNRWGNTSAAINKKTKKYFMSSCLEMANIGHLRLIFAKIDNIRIAGIALFDIINRREFYYSGRLLEETNLRAGKLLVYYSIIDAIQRKLKIYDFGFGGDEYKFEFTKEYQKVYSFFLSLNDYKIEFNKLFTGFEHIDPNYSFQK